MSLRDCLPALARALKRAFSEHGQPNSFAPAELEALYGGPDALVQGRVGRDEWLMAALGGELGGLGWHSTKPTYDRAPRRWYA
jgi:hypothetical protein